MSLDPASFRQYTERLQPGRSCRVDHDCGDGRTMKVEHKPDGYSAYCWRCGESGWIPHPTPSLAERVARLNRERDDDIKARAVLDLPAPRVSNPQEWPAPARVWLYKAGMSNDDIEALGFYWNPRLGRVVMPLYVEGRLVYWQARGFNVSRAKYINPDVAKDHLVAAFGTGSVLVLTEDILSAYKVGKVTTAWSIMGTSASDAVLNKIVADGRSVVICLDPDAAGRRGASKIRKALVLLGVDVRILHMRKDPKLLPIKEIADELGIF